MNISVAQAPGVLSFLTEKVQTYLPEVLGHSVIEKCRGSCWVPLSVAQSGKSILEGRRDESRCIEGALLDDWSLSSGHVAYDAVHCVHEVAQGVRWVFDNLVPELGLRPISDAWVH